MVLELCLYLLHLIAPAPLPCVEAVRWPGLALEPPPWAFITVPPRPCVDLRPSAWWMYTLDVDPAVPVEAEEYDGDIYQEEP